MYGESAGAPAWPLRQWCMASKWLLMLPTCVIERIRLKCAGQLGQPRVQLADAHAGDRRGDRLVGAANSAGAAGFRSQVSRWLGPPHSKMKMHDFSVERTRLRPVVAGQHNAGNAQKAKPAGLEQSAARDRGGRRNAH